MTLSAGRLRQRVDIVRLEDVDDGRGGFTSSSTPIAANVPAEVLALSGREEVLDKVLRGVRVYRVTLRHRTGVQEKDQLLYGSEKLNIRSAIDPDGRRERLVIMADTDGTL